MEMASGSSVGFGVAVKPSIRLSALHAPLTLDVRESHLMTFRYHPVVLTRTAITIGQAKIDLTTEWIPLYYGNGLS